MSQQKSDIGLVEKLGLKYYAFTINLLLYAGVYELTHSMEIVLFAFAVLPKIGRLFPNDDQRESPNSRQYNRNFLHMLAPAGSVMQLFYLIFYTWSHYDQISHSYQSLISCLFAIGFAGGSTIDACHELIHRNEIVLKSIGFIGLIPFQFTTYPVQHLYMHHKHVGTPEDDITAPKSMPFYIYYFKAVFSSYRQTFKYSKLFFAFCMVLQLTYLFVLYQLALIEFSDNQELALRKVGFFLLIAIGALFIMESIQYIEHYGLVYRKNNQQKPILQISSWNTAVNPLYNWSTFRFQRHSDHHMNAYKVYSSLELNQKMPVFPFSFAEGIATAWFPIFWYKAVDHLVQKVLNHEKITKQDNKKSRFWVEIAGSILGGLLVANAYFAYSQNIVA